jgi:hypothetical protein
MVGTGCMILHTNECRLYLKHILIYFVAAACLNLSWNVIITRCYMFVNKKGETVREMRKYFYTQTWLLYLCNNVELNYINPNSNYVLANTTLVWALKCCQFQN